MKENQKYLFKYKNILVFSSIFVIIIVLTALYSYSQYLKKYYVQAVLNQNIDLNNPPVLVNATSTQDQKLSTGTVLQKGSSLNGMLVNEQGKWIIEFTEIRTTTGKNEDFYGKSVLDLTTKEISKGVSAKIGNTVRHQTKTNVLGAIFQTNTDVIQESKGILPKGYILKIETQ